MDPHLKQKIIIDKKNSIIESQKIFKFSIKSAVTFGLLGFTLLIAGAITGTLPMMLIAAPIIGCGIFPPLARIYTDYRSTAKLAAFSAVFGVSLSAIAGIAVGIAGGVSLGIITALSAGAPFAVMALVLLGVAISRYVKAKKADNQLLEQPTIESDSSEFKQSLTHHLVLQTAPTLSNSNLGTEQRKEGIKRIAPLNVESCQQNFFFNQTSGYNQLVNNSTKQPDKTPQRTYGTTV